MFKKMNFKQLKRHTMLMESIVYYKNIIFPIFIHRVNIIPIQQGYSQHLMSLKRYMEK